MEWISVDDRVPKYGELVLVYMEAHERVALCTYADVFPIIVPDWVTGKAENPVTHWHPMPPPPKQGE